VVTSGKFRGGKGIRLLLEAFSLVKSTVPAARLLLVGDAAPEEMNSLRDMTSKLDIQDHTVFHQFTDRFVLCQIYNAADVGSWPGEPSVTVLEALATGLPCVLPGREYAYKVLRENGAAAFFSDAEPRDLAFVLSRVMNDPTYQRQIVANATKLVKERLSWNAIARTTLGLYSDARRPHSGV